MRPELVTVAALALSLALACGAPADAPVSVVFRGVALAPVGVDRVVQSADRLSLRWDGEPDRAAASLDATDAAFAGAGWARRLLFRDRPSARWRRRGGVTVAIEALADDRGSELVVTALGEPTGLEGWEAPWEATPAGAVHCPGGEPPPEAPAWRIERGLFAYAAPAGMVPCGEEPWLVGDFEPVWVQLVDAGGGPARVTDVAEVMDAWLAGGRDPHRLVVEGERSRVRRPGLEVLHRDDPELALGALTWLELAFPAETPSMRAWGDAEAPLVVAVGERVAR